jgi:two-component system LytT family sensor kinase
MIAAPVQDHAATGREGRLAAAYLGAWLPYGALWFLVARYVGEPFDRAALVAASRFAAASSLGVAIHWLCGRLAWPERRRVPFALAHLGASLVFGAGVLSVPVLAFAWRDGRPPAAGFRQTLSYLPFELMTDTCLYGLVAGASYTIRSQRRVREERLNALRAEAAASRAQLSALRAQLNPHFLFNALHSLGALVRHDAGAAEEALERLGGLLRYALDEAGERVPLAREWDFMRDYLELERLRLGDRLRVEERCDDDARGILVPPFTLQPLVENAIRHGVARVSEGGRVRITAHVQDDRLTLLVEDDGPGCTADAWRQASGLGLRSLRERLASGQGDDARLTVSTSPGAGFSARVELPRTGLA